MRKREKYKRVWQRVRVVLIILLCGSLFTGTQIPVTRAASTAVVTLSPGTVNVPNTYRVDISFSTNVTPGSMLSVTFDGSGQATSIPRTINEGYVGVYVGGVWYPSSHVMVNGQQVAVTMSSSMPPSSTVSLVFNAGAGITPVTAGQHTMTVTLYYNGNNMYDTGTGTYAIGTTQTGTAVSFDSVTINDPTFGKASGYQFTFTSGATLMPGSSTISIQFPTGFRVPATINGLNFGLTQGSLQVSSFQGNISVSGNTVTLTIPTPNASIGNIYSQFSAGIPTTVTCGPNTGITNPTVGGSYQFSLWTSLQTTPVTKSVTLGSGITGLSATVTPALGGTVAEYRLSFAVSTTGALTGGTDKITVGFPAGFVLPASISSGSVKVNNMPASAAVSGQNLVITVPVSVAASGSVSVDITTAAGIRNGPGSGSGYQLTVTTSADQLPVQSNSFVVTASVASGVSVAVVPAVKGATAAYTVTFTTGAGGTLSAGDTVSLFLPYGFMIPSTMDRAQVTIKTPASAASGIQPASVQCVPASQSVVLTLPSAASIAGGSTVAVSLPAVITNPAAGGVFTAKVSTSRETTAVDSAPFTIYNNPVSTLKVTPPTADGKGGYYTSQPSFTLVVDGPAGVTLSAFYRIDDAGAFVSYDVKASPAVKVPEGKHTIYYYSQDNLGNVEPTRTQQFLVDLTDPVITVSSPTQKAIVVQPTATVTGKVASLDLSSVQLTVNGQTTAVGADGSFSAPVSFSHEGENIITLVAVSASGRTSTVIVTVNYIARVTMTLVIGSPTVNLNNEFTTLEAAPFISRKGVTMVPLRFISEAFKADVAWDPVFRSVTLTLGGKVMRIQVGFLTADVNGKPFALQDAPVIVKGRTFVPLRFIAENFGAKVDWNASLKMVSIVYPKP